MDAGRSRPPGLRCDEGHAGWLLVRTGARLNGRGGGEAVSREVQRRFKASQNRQAGEPPSHTQPTLGSVHEYTPRKLALFRVILIVIIAVLVTVVV